MSRNRRTHPRRKLGDVELNLSAMLDMAFQLLTFFILTFRPGPAEIRVEMRMPPALPVTQSRQPSEEQPGANENNPDPLRQLTTLQITLLSGEEGSLRQIAVGDSQLGSMASLEKRLKEIFADKGAGFDQVVIHAGSNLHYESLMRVMDVCSRQKLSNGKLLEKLSFVEARE